MKYKFLSLFQIEGNDLILFLWFILNKWVTEYELHMLINSSKVSELKLL